MASHSGRPEQRGAVEDIARVAAQNAVALDAEEPARRFGDKHRTPVLSEQQNAVLQVAENLVEVFAQRGVDLFHVFHALADLLDLGGDERRHVLLFRGLFLGRFSLGRRSSGGGQAVELAADLRQRPEGQIAQQEGRQQRDNQRNPHQPECFPEQRLVDGAQQRGVNPHVDGGEELAVVFKRRHHVKDLGLAEDLHHHPDGAGLDQLL